MGVNKAKGYARSVRGLSGSLDPLTCPICTRVVRFRTSQYQEVGILILEKYTLSDLSTACQMFITKITYFIILGTLSNSMYQKLVVLPIF